MMTVSKGMTAGHAGGYYAREDYYLGERISREAACGAAKWHRLSGPVEPEDFRGVCKGEAPGGGQLVAAGHGRDHRTSEIIEVRRGSL